MFNDMNFYIVSNYDSHTKRTVINTHGRFNGSQVT